MLIPIRYMPYYLQKESEDIIMKYSIIECVNGTFSVKVETDNLQTAKVQFHDRCKILWSASDVKTATVEIVDENLNLMAGYKEYIEHADVVEE